MPREFLTEELRKSYIEKLLKEKQISRKNLQKRFKDLFDQIDSHTNTNLHGANFLELMYCLLYNTIGKCQNIICQNIPTFESFPIGYRPYCSHKCRAIANPKGFATKEAIQKQTDIALSKKTEIQKRIDDGLEKCDGCGERAYFYSQQNKRYRCAERVQNCPVTRNKMGDSVSAANKGKSRLESVIIISDEIQMLCNYGCGKVAVYKLQSQKDIIFCCSPAYQSCDISRNKRSEIMTEKYKDPEVKNLQISRLNASLQKSYGVNWPVEIEGHHARVAEILEQKYGKGVTCAALIPHLREANERQLIYASYSTKDYIWPSGKITKVQGYEDIAIDNLLTIFDEDEFADSKDIPTIKYQCENKERNYYPDLYLPKYNLMLEVKGQYTYLKDHLKNKHKETAAIQNGYNFMWLVYPNRYTPAIPQETIAEWDEVIYNVITDDNQFAKQDNILEQTIDR